MVYFPSTRYKVVLQAKLAKAISQGIIQRDSLPAFFAAHQQNAENPAAPQPTGFAHPQPPDLESLYRLDPQALTQVHQLYFADIYRYARFRVNDENIAEDLTAEVFLRFIEALQARKGPKTSIKGYLMGMITNRVNDYFRKAYRHKTTGLTEDVPAANPTLEDWFEASEQRKNVHQALKQLTTDQQQVLALRFGSSLSISETAALMKKRENAVKALQFRALAALRRHLEGPNG